MSLQLLARLNVMFHQDEWDGTQARALREYVALGVRLQCDLATLSVTLQMNDLDDCVNQLVQSWKF